MRTSCAKRTRFFRSWCVRYNYKIIQRPSIIFTTVRGSSVRVRQSFTTVRGSGLKSVTKCEKDAVINLCVVLQYRRGVKRFTSAGKKNSKVSVCLANRDSNLFHSDCNEENTQMLLDENVDEVWKNANFDFQVKCNSLEVCKVLNLYFLLFMYN